MMTTEEMIEAQGKMVDRLVNTLCRVVELLDLKTQEVIALKNAAAHAEVMAQHQEKHSTVPDVVSDDIEKLRHVLRASGLSIDTVPINIVYENVINYLMARQDPDLL